MHGLCPNDRSPGNRHMAAERTPHTDNSVLGWILAAIARFAVRFPWTTLLLSLVGIVASVFLSSTRLTYHTSRAALLDRSSEVNRRWLDYVEEFSDKEDVVLVVEGEGPGTITPALDDLAAGVLRDKRLFQAVFHRLDLDKLRTKGLHYLPAGQLAAMEGFLGEAAPIVENGWALLNPGHMASAMAAQLQAVPPAQAEQALVAARQKLSQMSQSLAALLRDPRAYKSPWPDMSGAAGAMQAMESRHLLTRNGKMGFVVLQFKDDPENDQSFIRNSEGVDALRRLIAEAKQRHPKVQIGLTGLPVMDNDEMRCSQSSMTLVTLLSLVGVVAVLVAGFGGVRHSVLVMVILTIGTVWTMGYTALTVGHLNILSSAFGSILIGLGNDYGAYFVARYLERRASNRSVDDALIETARSVGPSITVGAMATALAFYTAGLTEFIGVKELGLIAGGGIVLCWWATVTVLPAMIHLWDVCRPQQSFPVPLDLRSWVWPARTMPIPMLALSLAGTFFLATKIDWGRFDNNLLNLQPEGLESVELERKLLAETDENAWFALSMAATPQELQARKAEFLKLPSVQRVDEIASLFPANEEQKRPILERIGRRLANLPQQPPQIPLTPAAQLEQMLLQGQRLMAGSPQEEEFRRHLADICDSLRRLPETEYYARLGEFQQRMAGDLLVRLQTLRAVANPEPPQLADLPEGLVVRFVGKTGRYLMRIYCKGDIWDPVAMREFIDDIRKVDPGATGNPVLVYEGSLQMRRSFDQATRYSLATILPVVFLSFFNVRLTLLALIPLFLGMLQMYGLMGLLGIPRNPANLIALPLMLGLGVDNGTHIVHDYLQQKGRYRMTASTSVAVVVNSLTTIVGFAVLVLADHRGLQSLGRVLTIGESCCLFHSLVTLPAILDLMSRRRKEEKPTEPPPVEEPAANLAPHWQRARARSRVYTGAGDGRTAGSL